MTSSPPGSAASEPSEPALPAHIGHYRIVRRIAEGGMGVVYEAEQESPRRTVALKVVRGDLTRGDLLRRFEHEAQVLGRLQHPCIAQIFEAGSAETPAGRQVYFAMELVEGVTLDEHVRREGLDLRARVELLRRVCEGVHHAHQKGVIHRDLKPANVLVERGGRPKILDFGVARATDSDVQAVTLRTSAGEILGTIPYMSPEQIAADPAELDLRSDVYSLGVMLYELLTERLPYDVTRVLLPEAVRIIREVEPRRLSTVNRHLRGDLDTIVAKALEKDKARRYASAAELAADLGRYLDDEPIQARPPSVVYQLRKLARRHRALFTGAAVVLVVLVAGVIVSTAQAVRALRAERLAVDRLEDARAASALAEERRREADLARAEAETSAEEARREARASREMNEFLVGMLESANPFLTAGRDVTVRELLDGAERELAAGRLADAPLVDVAVRGALGRTRRGLGDVDAALAMHEEALRIARESGADAALLGAAELDYASSLLAFGEFEAVERIAREVLAREGPGGADDGRLELVALELLSAARYNQGQAAEALELDRRAVELRRRRSGERSPSVATALVAEAFHLAELDRHTEAEPVLREALSILAEAGITDEPRLADVQRRLGVCLSALGRRAEAEELLSASLATVRAAYPAGSLHVADAAVELAAVLLDLERLEEGRALAEEALAIRRERLGPHRDTATALTTVAEALRRQGDLDGAEQLLRDSLAMRVVLFGELGPAVHDSYRRLGSLAEQQRDPDRAVEHYRAALAVMDAWEGAADVRRARIQLQLGRLLRLRGEREEAEELLTSAHATYAAARPPEDRQRMEIADELGQLRLDLEQWTRAEEILREVEAAARAQFGEGHILFHHLAISLGAALAGQGRFEEAETRMLPSFEPIASHPKIWPSTKVQAAERIARLYADWGREDEAARWRETAAELGR